MATISPNVLLEIMSSFFLIMRALPVKVDFHLLRLRSTVGPQELYCPLDFLHKEDNFKAVSRIYVAKKSHKVLPFPEAHQN